jgi:hypothetical protein
MGHMVGVAFVIGVLFLVWCLCMAAALSDKEMEESIRKMVKDAKEKEE